MFFRVFTLHPDIFSSFLANSLIARGLSKKIIQVELINWREKFGLGNYRQVDDRPFGGGSGMVLMPQPIFQALKEYSAITDLFKLREVPVEHRRIFPNNQFFFERYKSGNLSRDKKVTINMTPRGFTFNQQIAQWLSQFEEINLLCGRYEGFDARVSELVDLELSVGDYVLNGGELPAMTLIESISRLIPGFIEKSESVGHDSFSGQLNVYEEQKEFVIGKKNMLHNNLNSTACKAKSLKSDLFCNKLWQEEKLPLLEHPQYTRPGEWMSYLVPSVLLEGNHKKIQDWRLNWFDN
jgi:tRNA (guanine37-N1)-methyltransferase